MKETGPGSLRGCRMPKIQPKLSKVLFHKLEDNNFLQFINKNGLAHIEESCHSEFASSFKEIIDEHFEN